MDKTKIPVADVMTRKPIGVKSGQSVNFASKRMKKYGVSSVLIMNKKELIGIITADDMVYKVLADKKDPQQLSVDDIMSTSLTVIEPTASIHKAMDMLTENDVKQLPVVSNGMLVGLVTIKDIIRVEPTLVDMMVENIRFEEQQRQDMIEKYAESEIDESLFE